MLKSLLRPLRKFFDSIWLAHSFRYSVYFSSLQRRHQLDPREQVMADIMNFCAISEVPGDYLEFGTFRGGTFCSAWHLARRFGLKGRHFYAFDSFEGLPNLKQVDAGGGFKPGEYACSVDEFRSILKNAGLSAKSVTLVPGWFDRSLTDELHEKLPIKKAAVVWIDCDLYESTVPILAWITRYLQPGTIVAFDDWFCFKGDPTKGEQRALSEWLRDHPEWQFIPWKQFGIVGMAFIVCPKAGTGANFS